MATLTQTNPATPLTTNEHLLRWVGKMAEPDATCAHPVGGWHERRVRPAPRRDGRERHLHTSKPEALAGMFSGSFRQKRRRPRRRSHVHLFALQRRGRPDQ